MSILIKGAPKEDTYKLEYQETTDKDKIAVLSSKTRPIAFVGEIIKENSPSISPVYTITCLTKLEEKNTWPDFGCTAFMGFYHDKNDAISAVMENACDINETCYEYAVVEEIPPGVYAYPRPRWFFKFDGKRYIPIEEPKYMTHIANVL